MICMVGVMLNTTVRKDYMMMLVDMQGFIEYFSKNGKLKSDKLSTSMSSPGLTTWQIVFCLSAPSGRPNPGRGSEGASERTPAQQKHCDSSGHQPDAKAIVIAVIKLPIVIKFQRIINIP